MATDTLLDEARDLLDDAVKLRRTLHRQPEIGLELPFAQERVVEALDGLPLEVTRGRSTTSVTAMLTGSRPGPTIVLRGDMDALPMPKTRAWSSRPRSKGPCTRVVTISIRRCSRAARVLSARRAELAGRVLFMFQPGEEGQHGARFMLEDGLLDVGADSPVDQAFALHVTTMLPSGFVRPEGGPDARIRRRLAYHGHRPGRSRIDALRGARPDPCRLRDRAGDPNDDHARRVDVFDPAVVTVTQIVSGTTSNVIPETVFILGTIRAVSERTRSLVHDELRRVAEGVATAHGATAAVEIEAGYPCTINDNDVASFASGVALDLLGDDHVLTMPTPVMGAEDWSYVLQRVPGAMAFLGACMPGLDPRTAPPNHSNRVTFDEAAMTSGIGLYAAVALRHLAG